MFRNNKSNKLSLRGSNKLEGAEINLNILKLKEGMNSKRVNYVLPEDHNIVITGNYLVGLLEGDGSFYLNKPPTPCIVFILTNVK